MRKDNLRRIDAGEPAARAGTRTAATDDHMRVMKILMQLKDAADWRGVAAKELAARAVAAAVRTSMPGVASFACQRPGHRVSVAAVGLWQGGYHKQRLAIEKEVGDLATP